MVQEPGFYKTRTLDEIKGYNHRLIGGLEVLYLDHQNDEVAIRQDSRHVKIVNDLVENNYRLVPWVLSKFFSWADGELRKDLTQEGNIGLIAAAKHYNPYRGIEDQGTPYEFSTYAVMHIFYAVLDNINQNNLDRAIIVPRHLKGANISNSMERVERDLIELNAKFEREDISYKEWLRRTGLKMNEIAGLERSLSAPVYLSGGRKFYDPEEGENFEIDLDPPDEEPGLFEQVLNGDMAKHIDDVVTTLDVTEQIVLALRFGLASAEGEGYRRDAYDLMNDAMRDRYDFEGKLTQKNIKEILGYAKSQSIGQIEDKALRRLRHPSRSRYVRDFVE